MSYVKKLAINQFYKAKREGFTGSVINADEGGGRVAPLAQLTALRSITVGSLIRGRRHSV